MDRIGNIVYELAPTPENQRNSEGAFITLKNGSLRFYYSRFTGGGGDDAYADIAFIESSDDGKTWRDGGIVFTRGLHNAKNIMSVSLLRMQNGDIGIFYLVRHSFAEIRIYMHRSSDEGATWSAATPCIPQPGYHVVNNDRIVRLASGRLIIPASLSGLFNDQVDTWKSFDGIGSVCFFLSDDDGATWREAKNQLCLNSRHSKSGMQEPGVVELSDGHLYGFARTDLGCQYEFHSFDGGEHWTAPAPTLFTGPCSPLSMKRIPGTQKLFASWSTIPNYQTREPGGTWGGRTRYAYAIVDAHTLRFDAPVVVEDDNNAGFCYCALHFTGDAVLLAYCGGTAADGGCLSRTKLRRIPLSALGE